MKITNHFKLSHDLKDACQRYTVARTHYTISCYIIISFEWLFRSALAPRSLRQIEEQAAYR